MRKTIKYPLYLLGTLVLLLLAAFIWLNVYFPNVGPPPVMTVEITDAKVERGHYLANHVMLCMDCHATRDWTLFAGPPIPGTEGGGGDVFDQEFGFPGRFVAPNITSYKLSDWTDGEIFQAITSGVNKGGRALFPIMPWSMYAGMERYDLEAIYEYLTSLEPVDNPVVLFD